MEARRKKKMTRSTPHDLPLNRDATNESQREPCGDYTTLPTKGTDCLCYETSIE